MHCGRGLNVRGRDHQLWAWPSCKARGPRRELIGCGSKGAGLWQKGAGPGAEAGSRGSCGGAGQVGGAQGSFRTGGQKQGVRSSHGADLRSCGARGAALPWVPPAGSRAAPYLPQDPPPPFTPIFPYRNPWASQALPGAEPPPPPPAPFLGFLTPKSSHTHKGGLGGGNPQSPNQRDAAPPPR